MSRKSEGVKQWRRTTKNRIVQAFGGKCCICGYNKCQDALELHHITPSEKDFSLGKIRAHSKSWNTIVIELRKCVLVCSNCHKEVHANISEIPKDAPKFNECFADYKSLIVYKKHEFDECPICGKQKPKYNIVCSHECAAKRSRKVNWEAVDLITMKDNNMSNTEIGDLFGVSEGAVRKRLKKLGIWEKYKRL
jgi:predicted nucleic acid-binding Zn ribbon protein